MDTSSFISLFREERYVSELKGTRKNQILDELLGLLKQNHVVNHPDLLLETLKKRETLGSTGLGKNVAIPHCRTLTVSELIVIVGHSNKGVDWQAMDKKPVTLIFLIIAPPQEKQNIYLPVLGKICEIVRENKIRKMLIRATDFRDFINIIGAAA
ncbi:PTS sugar transporter subunit IIA [bacterium]|nr:PTS sugar transporter subunit IIA [bacterium]